MADNRFTSEIIGACIEVHKELGPGLLESAYEHCLVYELRNLGIYVEQQVMLPIIYKNAQLDVGYRIDLLVENEIILEIKAVKELEPIHTAQLLTYLKLKKLHLGLLINFNSIRVVDGIKRVINGYK